MLGTYHLTALFDVLNKLHFLYKPPELWQFVLEHACKIVQAEAGTFFEVSTDGQTLQVTECHGISKDRLQQAPFEVGVGISGWVAQYQQPALVNDVRQDHRFSRQADMITGFTTKSILCIPIFSMQRAYGVIEILNKRTGQFTPQDQEFMTLLGRQTAIAYQNLMLIAEVQQKEFLLESLLANFSGGLIVMGSDGNVLVLNPAAAALLLLPSADVRGKSSSTVLAGYPWLIETLQKTLATRQTVSRQETLLGVQGQEQRFGYTTLVITDPKKQLLGCGILFQKI